MENDGMLINFEVGNVPLKAQVKFTGGRWRDRVKARRSLKRGPEDSTGSTASTLHSVVPRDDGFETVDRPAKRARTGQSRDDKTEHASVAGQTDLQPAANASAAHTGPGPHPLAHGLKSGHVSSRLFTSNPTPVTKFDYKTAEETTPAEPSNAPLTDEAENFLALGLSRRLAQHLATKLGMKAPTAIQKNTIPELVKGDGDAFLQAETGSGKTLAYLLPIVHRILALSQKEDGTSKETKVHRNSGLFAIVLAPTRELCKQIATVLEKLLRCAPWLVSTTVIGGESKKSEKARIRKGVNILIATPGRLTDHLDNTKVLDVRTVRWLVLDEGDRMMEMGFEDDLRTIVAKIRQDVLLKENKDGVVLDGVLPSRRVTILCSATMKMNVQKLGEISLKDATHITATKSETDKDAPLEDAVFSAPSQLKQSILVVPAKLRLVTLIAYLRSTFARRGLIMKAIVFLSCADSVNYHFDLLKTTDPDLSTSTSKPSRAGKISHTHSTVAPAAYITSRANPTIMLHKLHGSLAQPVRTSTLHAFIANKEPSVLITTDISSRGLDVPAVDLVIEYDPAFSVDDHVHRIGRTARAGRSGRAVLFLLPGCEEGYISLLQPASTAVTQPYTDILRKGLATAVNLPPDASIGGDDSEKQTWMARAETLQTHFERRLLVKPDQDKDAAEQTNHKGKKAHYARPNDDPLLDAARQAFRSHIRAYATHIKEERVYFDMTKLHLGHMAKSFGLREAPGGIGGGVSRRTHKAAAGGLKGSAEMSGGPVDMDAVHVAPGNTDATRRMREKMDAVMNAAGEFNIG